ncbi:hypothetical protein [Xanthomonas translucens]|uniref:hypothetical protein n=1 Tax=Xanthomonas campestris pv. translucens TaxID=343 RepID=UPI00071E81CE|nr:hypothetical protein [Xanthomonas translucens]KTF40783.1 hypothetical protein OZ12_05025 [Xanthomonas translucens pv. translucens]KWV15616.1 hypothetical protein ATB54_01925 [Xanthomonas translucens]MCS3360591.1 hypothetical protein [Xanthomonas translucens pv. translucens]MCS3374396.1 hypothetical protein [Xanthomonas translucens pv. translucens]MCT8274316.1 hypothetical protein [Xanthomonas translucens pv. translucens]
MLPHIATFAATLAFVAATTRAFAHRGKPLLPPHVPTAALPPAALPDAAVAAPATVSQETC